MKAPMRDQIEVDNDFFQYMISLLPPQLITDKEPEDSESEQEEEEVKEENTKGQKRKNADGNKQKKQKKKLKKQDIDMNSSDLVATDTEFMEVDNDDTKTNLDAEDLQTKLRKKLETLRAMRCKPGSVERQEQNRLKRRLSKAKLKERRKQEKQEKNFAAKTVASAAGGVKTKSDSKDANSKLFLNEDDKIMFSKFNFNTAEDLVAHGKQKKKNKSALPTGKNYKQLLERATKQKEKLETLQKQDQKKAQELKEKILWKTALSKAEGIKVKDDVELIKKSLKKKEQKSERSKKKWKERAATVEKKMKARQDKRKANLAKRKDMKKEKMIKKSKKKGRIVGGI